MIVKIKGTGDNEESWRWYEADRVQSSTKPLKEWCDEDGCLGTISGPGINEEVMIKETPAGATASEDEMITLIAFISKDGTANNVFCNTRAFLLNDAGETIDRLI